MGLLQSKKLIQIKLYYLEKITSQGTINIQILQDDLALKILEQNKVSKLAYQTAPNKILQNGVLQPKEPFKINPNKDVKVLTTFWKMLNWSETIDIQSKSKKIVNQEQRFDYLKSIDLKFKKQMVDWDMSENGVKIPCNQQNINLLLTPIANALQRKFSEFVNE